MTKKRIKILMIIGLLLIIAAGVRTMYGTYEETEVVVTDTYEKPYYGAASSTARTKTVCGIKASEEEIALLVALCRHEAGTHYQNSVAVANVVINRVKSSQYPNTIKGVIYQKGQFSGVNNGVLNKYLKNPSSNCKKAVKAALNGTNNIGTRKSFRMVTSRNRNRYANSKVIGDNVFF
jgi:spore germination cell wall hydrolase CwlJ-like protein